MIILKKKRDDGSYLQMKLSEGATWPEVVNDFVNFLQGCGYIVEGIEVAEYLMEEYGFQNEELIPLEKVKRKLKK
jgi:hypothetical protein